VSAVATKPRLGFLGVGWIGRKRLEAIAASGVAEVTALADPRVASAWDRLDELLAAELDGIVIATPTALHADQALTSLERGLPVFCQKPLALDAAAARRVVDAARDADVLLAVDLCYRQTQAARSVRDVVRSGEIGEVYAVELVFHNAYAPNGPSAGGCLLDLGVHLVDLALWTLDFPAAVRVESALRDDHYAAAQIELDTGAVVRVACSWRLHAGSDCVIEASFYGTRGGASLRNVEGSFFDFVAERYDGAGGWTLATPPDDWGGRAIVEWATRVAAGDRYDPTAEQYVRVHEILDRVGGSGP
jgi:predicted dehydrogenase